MSLRLYVMMRLLCGSQRQTTAAMVDDATPPPAASVTEFVDTDSKNASEQWTAGTCGTVELTTVRHQRKNGGLGQRGQAGGLGSLYDRGTVASQGERSNS